MRGIRFDDAKHFYERVAPVFSAHEIENSLFLGVAKRLADGGERAFLCALESETRIVAAALRTPPYQLSVCAADLAAIARLVEAVRKLDAAIPAVMGRQDLATHFAEHWVAQGRGAWRIELDMTFYALRRVVAPPVVARGALRLAVQPDLDWLADTHAAFAFEVGLPERERGADHAARVMQRKIRRSEQFVWEVGGHPVAFIGFTPTGITGARIGPVMTTPAERRKGYASAAVAALSQRLLDGAFSWCGLFADVKNPDSNRIYQRLGYREACRYRSIEFSDPVRAG